MVYALCLVAPTQGVADTPLVWSYTSLRHMPLVRNMRNGRGALCYGATGRSSW